MKRLMRIVQHIELLELKRTQFLCLDIIKKWCDNLAFRLILQSKTFKVVTEYFYVTKLF